MPRTQQMGRHSRSITGRHFRVGGNPVYPPGFRVAACGLARNDELPAVSARAEDFVSGQRSRTSGEVEERDASGITNLRLCGATRMINPVRSLYQPERDEQ
jgi:hypothetical protein